MGQVDTTAGPDLDPAASPGEIRREAFRPVIRAAVLKVIEAASTVRAARAVLAGVRVNGVGWPEGADPFPEAIPTDATGLTVWLDGWVRAGILTPTEAGSQ